MENKKEWEPGECIRRAGEKMWFLNTGMQKPKDF